MSGDESAAEEGPPAGRRPADRGANGKLVERVVCAPTVPRRRRAGPWPAPGPFLGAGRGVVTPVPPPVAPAPM